MASDMMLRQEPTALAPDATPCGDFFIAGQSRADAKRGSRLLRIAILRLQFPQPRRKRNGRGVIGKYGPRPTEEQRAVARERIERIKAEVARHFRLPPDAMISQRGPQKTVERRQLAMYLVREIVKASYPDIAKCFGGKDHTTVMYACRVVPERISPKTIARVRAAVLAAQR